MKVLFVGQIHPHGWVSTTWGRMEALCALGHELDGGREAEFFASEDELIEKTRYYLSHDDDRRRVAAAAGRARCLESGYSSTDRVREILGRVRELR